MDKSSRSTPRPSRLLWGGFIALIIALSLTLAYKLWPLLHPVVLEAAEVDPSCDLTQGPCQARFPDGGRVRLDIQPRGIPTSTPLSLSVTIAGLSAETVEVDFVGVDMYMGFNRVGLTERSPGHYSGKGMIPVCVRARMDWEVRVLIHAPDGLVAASFRFETLR